MSDAENPVPVILNEIKHISRAIEGLTTELRQTRDLNEKRFSDFDAKLDQKADIERVEKLEGHLVWINRLIISTVVLVVMASAGIGVGIAVKNHNAAPVHAAKISTPFRSTIFSNINAAPDGSFAPLSHF